MELGPFVHRSIGLMRRQLPPGSRFEIEVPEKLVLRGSQEELHQVLLNLVLNARDAMPDGGTIRIVAHGVVFDRVQASAHHLAAPGTYVELAVIDTGIGMDEPTQARAFEPFFTTKPPGHGTGLGLAMVHAVVARHGGGIVLDSAPGRGTTITMWIPAD
jgi:signal transduction histidine kinase